MKRNKKLNNMLGFTLAELLAVLIVLAIIALIIFPIVDDLIDDSRKDAFLQSVNGLRRGAEIDYQGDDYKGDRTYEYKNGKFTLVDVKGNIKEENIKVDGLIDGGVGEVYVDEEGEISLTVYNKKYCATKGVDDQTITIDDKTSSNCIISQCPRYAILGKTIKSCDIQTIDPDSNPRYVGPTPNNYVSFNGELWRIIGVFNGQTKIIKDDYYNTSIRWDYNSDGSYLNNWATASLQLALNNTTDGYIKTIQTNDPTSYGYIDLEHVWNIGGTPNNNSSTRSDFYTAERSNTPAGASGSEATWIGAIGLMYPSDYGYASSGLSETCNNTVMYSWSNEPAKTECAENSWLYDSSQYQWTITPRSVAVDLAFFVNTAGLVNGNYLNSNIAARPVLFLKSDTKIVGGQGTNTDPYILGI